MYATFAIPQVKEADLRRCRIRTELVCGAAVGPTPIVRLELRSVFPGSVQSACSV